MEKKSRKKSLVLLLSMTLLLAGNFQTTQAADLDRTNAYSIYLSISPSTIETDSNSNPSGYVYVLNKNGLPITSDRPVEISLSSDNPKVASVPNTVTLEPNSAFAKFEIDSLNIGTTTLVAQLNEKMDFKEITVGIPESFLPDDVHLVLNLPSSKMHVNSEMPFSVFLKTSDGKIVRAPFDIEVDLEYEKSLATPSSEKLTIKQGENYAWGTLKTYEKIGSTFIRAVQPDMQLDTVENIQISSTRPTSLDIQVYPKLIPAEIDRTIDIFVSLRDSSGNPTVAHKDIPLDFFSDEQDYVGDDLDDTMKETKMVIKKGEFGYHFRQNLDLIGLVKNNIIVGVSADGFGVATDVFSTVGESISVENKRITDVGILSSDRAIKATDDKAIQFFGPDSIPSNATAYFAYQMSIVEIDEDDPPEVEEYIKQIKEDFGEDYKSGGSESDISEKVQKFNIDYLDDRELYPIQANENYQSNGLIKLLKVVTTNDELASVDDPGSIKGSYSYGVAKIKTTQKSGPLGISVSLKGIGSETFQTNVVNSLALKKVILFSPTGNENLLFERDGTFDMFVVALDGANRPKVLDFDEKFLITPTNSLLDLKKGTTFTQATLQGDSFSIQDDDPVKLEVSPIGENANTGLSSTHNFEADLSSKLKVSLTTENVNIENKADKSEQTVGIIQLTDSQNNPIPSTKDIKVKLSSSKRDVATVNDSIILPKGSSFIEFPIGVTGNSGSSIITASAKGLVGDDSSITAKSSASKLSVFTSGLVEPIPSNEDVSVTIFVDDENADSVAGAKVFIYPNENATASTDLVRTGSDGSATFSLTALSGPEVSVDFVLQAEGYVDGKEKIDILVDYDPQESMSIADIELPQELVYVIIGGIGVVGVVVALFLKKSKEPLDEEEPWEEEDI